MSDFGDSSEEWAGGLYGVAMEYACDSKPDWRSASSRLWQHPSLRMSSDLKRGSPGSGEGDLPKRTGRLYGTAKLANCKDVPCGNTVTHFEGDSDWLELYLPMSELGKTYPVGGFPFQKQGSDRAWQQELNSWFVGLAAYVFAEAPFELALIGFDLDIKPSYFKLIQQQGIPPKRFEGFLVRSSSGLCWYASNES